MSVRSVARGAGALIAGTTFAIAVPALAGLSLPYVHLAEACGGALAGALAPEISRWSGFAIGAIVTALAAAMLTAIWAHSHLGAMWAADPHFWVSGALTVVAAGAGAILAGWLRTNARQRRSS